MRGWIRGNTKIGPVLDVKVCYHKGRYGVEIMIESLFRDRTVSWVRIVNYLVGDRKSAVFLCTTRVGWQSRPLQKKNHLWKLPLLRTVGIHLLRTACT